MHGSTINSTIKNNLKLKWITVIMNWNWYVRIINTTDQLPHLLRKQKPPTDNQLKPLSVILKVLLDASWDSPPWTLNTGDFSQLPRDLAFSPPPVKNITVMMRKPVSTESHVMHDLSDVSNEKGINSKEAELIEIWGNDTGTDDLRESMAKSAILYNKILENPSMANVTRLVNTASNLLVLDIYHKLDPKIKKSFGTAALRKVIDNIWNMFSNVLPVEIAYIYILNNFNYFSSIESLENLIKDLPC